MTPQTDRPARPGGVIGVLRASALALAFVATMLCLAAPAHAAYGDLFGLADAEGPAFDGAPAFSAGTCALGAGNAAVGTPPANPMDCIDLGTWSTPNTDSPWTVPPAWRLASTTQAGAHPDATAAFWFKREPDLDPFVPLSPDGLVKSTRVDLPVGFTGDPTAVPKCASEEARQVPARCGPETQVGVATVVITSLGNGISRTPVYNVEPRDGTTAEFLISAAAGLTNIPVTAKVRSGGDHGITVMSAQLPTGFAIHAIQFTLWGVPWAHTHDAWRTNSDVDLLAPQDGLDGGISSKGLPESDRAVYSPYWGPIRPFINNPTECTGQPLTTRLTINSWQHPETFLGYDAPAPATTGCGDVPFDGALDVRPKDPQAGAPTSYAFDLSVPQTSDPDVLATSHLKRARVVLPEGMRVNPSSADGLKGCTLAQANLGSEDDSDCPPESMIGSLTIDTPLLDDPLQGSIYLAQPHDNRFDALLSLILVARGPGVVIKIPGRIDPDPVTGQLTADFDNNPQLPFSRLHLEFKDGPRAPLSNPPTCGTKTTHTELTSWSGKTVTSDSSFEITGCDGPRGFYPQFDAGTTNPLAGAFSPFTMTVAREDMDQEFDTISLNMPSGLLGMISSVPLCPEEQLADGSCGAESRIGSTTVGAGAGPSPLFLKGDVFIGGQYKGAPFSLSIVVDTKGQSGPFDLGKVVVRAPIYVNAEQAKLDVPADPLPRILQGIPLQIRYVNVTLDRPGFIFNATNCGPSGIGATLTGTEGGTIERSARYQPSGCSALPFAPTMTAKTKGKLKFKNGADLHVHIAQQPGEAAIKSVAVRLPKELPSRLRPTINNACDMAVFKSGFLNCPEDSYIGTSTAKTPLFDEPLSGPVYVVSRAKEVPQIVIILFGKGIAEGITLQLYGDIIIDSGGGRTLSTFHMVPDVPISSFDLDLPTGPHSILDAPSDDLCRGPLTMDVTEIAQSGKRQAHQVKIAVSDCPKVAKVKYVRTRYDKGLVKVSVIAPAAGRAFISGNGIWSTSRKIIKKGRYVIQARVTDAARARMKRRGVRFTAKVTFQPNNAPKSSTVTGRTVVPRARRP